jgi:hypothetical protein
MEAQRDPESGTGLSSAPAARTRTVLLALIGAYAVAVFALVALDQIQLIWKSMIIPGLAVAAASVGRFRAFVRDWAVFLGAVMLFDAVRGTIYGVVTYLELPVHMAYAIDAEHAIFGDPLLTVQVQSLLTPSGVPTAFDRFLAVVYGSHFLLFLIYGLVIWMVREHEFGRFKLGLVLVMYIGLICYVAVPTVPPWMASDKYFTIPPILDMGGKIFHNSLPVLTAAFDINPIAAMPSLHCAFPTLLTLITFRCFGRWGFAMGAYTLCVYLSTVHLGHHYGVDVLGGIALALLSYAITYGGDAVARAVGALRPASTTAAALRMRILVSGLLLMLTIASGIVGPMLTGGTLDTLPSEAFIARELDGKSPVANYYRGKRAFKAGRYADAKRLLTKAVSEVPNQELRESAAGALALSAYQVQDYPLVVAAAGQLHGMPTGVALIVAESLVRTGKQKAGFDLFDNVARVYPDHPDVAAMRTRLAAFHQGS